ncbi:hypothetical protein D3C86_1312890 [compost metagenome]
MVDVHGRHATNELSDLSHEGTKVLHEVRDLAPDAADCAVPNVGEELGNCADLLTDDLEGSDEEVLEADSAVARHLDLWSQLVEGDHQTADRERRRCDSQADWVSSGRNRHRTKRGCRCLDAVDDLGAVHRQHGDTQTRTGHSRDIEVASQSEQGNRHATGCARGLVEVTQHFDDVVAEDRERLSDCRRHGLEFAADLVGLT